MKKGLFTVTENVSVADRTLRMTLAGDASAIVRPGQFVNVEIEGLYLRRPISVCDWDAGKVVLVRPDRYVEAGRIADYLCEGYTVLLDLEEVPPEANRRIVDFLSGSAYARDGRMLQVACKAYLLAPSGVDILDGETEAPDDWEYDRAFGF